MPTLLPAELKLARIGNATLTEKALFGLTTCAWPTIPAAVDLNVSYAGFFFPEVVIRPLNHVWALLSRRMNQMNICTYRLDCASWSAVFACAACFA